MKHIDHKLNAKNEDEAHENKYGQLGNTNLSPPSFSEVVSSAISTSLLLLEQPVEMPLKPGCLPWILKRVVLPPPVYAFYVM